MNCVNNHSGEDKNMTGWDLLSCVHEINVLIAHTSCYQGCHLAFFETKSGKFGLIFTALVAKKYFWQKNGIWFQNEKIWLNFHSLGFRKNGSQGQSTSQCCYYVVMKVSNTLHLLCDVVQHCDVICHNNDVPSTSSLNRSLTVHHWHWISRPTSSIRVHH